MSAWSDLRDSIRKIILMQDKIDRLAQGVDRVASEVMDHEKRLIRIETLIEVAQNRGPSGNPPPRRIE